MAWEAALAHRSGYWLAAVLFAAVLIFALQLVDAARRVNALMTDAYGIPEQPLAATRQSCSFLRSARRGGSACSRVCWSSPRARLSSPWSRCAGAVLRPLLVSDAIGGAGAALCVGGDCRAYREDVIP